MVSLSLKPLAIAPATNSGIAPNMSVSSTAAMNLEITTVSRLTGVASRWTMLPSSISAPSTLVPMTSAVSGRITENPKSPRTWPGHSAPGGRAALSTTVTTIRISGGIANRSARLRPNAPRSVIEATTPLIRGVRGGRPPGLALNKPTIERLRSGFDQVGEDALQRLVLGQQLAQPDPPV